MSQLKPEIPFVVRLWIRSGYVMKLEVSAETYQVGVNFKALNKVIRVTFGVLTQRGRETRNEKNLSRVLDGATRMAFMRALK